MSVALGAAACGVSAVFFGSMFVPVKKYNAGDGIFVQFMMAIIIFVIGFCVYAFEGFPPFFPLAMLGGFFWTIGNATAIPIIRRLGMALGMLIWNTTNCLSGWAGGRFGLFGMTARPPSSPVLNYAGLVCVIIGGIIFSQVRSGPMKKKKDEEGSDAEKVALDTQNSNSEEDEKVEIKGEEDVPFGGRPLGFALALIAGVFYGITFVPVIYIQDNVPGAPQDGLSYVFSHFTGVLLTASALLLGWAVFYRSRPPIDGQLTLPSAMCGALWGIAQTSFFVANENLSQTVTFPIITMLPGCIASAWSIFFFREIQGRRNFIIMGVAMSITITGAVLVGLSKSINL